ncbi:SMEK domain-containing protein [Pedobacter gandavensis]|uniref:SMEK domain-containing protein n=1 Tax=Pedobacter gandavensis TaxID=2679963 RepID=UPI0029316F85|nr:SMEK domain-containing protein [Pedobacter gandavensis]
MNQIDNLNKIKKYLSRYQQLVKINTSNNEYDINIHSENTLIPILNVAFNANFVNANISKKNAEAIDLIDVKKRIGIQVTSTVKIAKVKSTLEKFVKSNFRNEIDTVYIYMLTDKQKKYSQQSIDRSKGNLNFTVKKNIIDAADIYGMLKSNNDIPKSKFVADILEENFSDSIIHKGFTFDQFDGFKKSYREKCLTNFSRLNFFGLFINNKPREVELYSLFVPPVFEAHTFDDLLNISNTIKKFDFVKEINLIDLHQKSVKLESIQYISAFEKFTSFSHKNFFGNNIKFDELYDGSENLVVLGDPGAGKSSMIKYSICKILEEDETIFSSPNIYNQLPLRIELHKYNSAKATRIITLSRYMENLLAEEYQTYISSGNLEYLFKFFPIMVFFDGLDEIFDVHERLQVRNDIENFLKSYPNIKGIVTSRFESYQEVSMNSKQFRTVVVKDFDETQVMEYVNKWYSLQEENADIRKDEIAHCLEQLKGVDSELKHNPLLLSLILILYRSDREIPTSKLKIYEGCTYTIVDSRDTKEKKLTAPIQPRNKISIFSALAFWQFNQKGTDQNLTFSKVESFVKQYLIKNEEYDSEFQAKQAAQDFLSFAKTRSIYLENKFTHKTFLEYFASYFIYSNIFNKINKQDVFKELLDENIGLSSWAVVLELLICKIDEQMIDAEIIDNIIENQIDQNGTDALLFFLQIIKYLQNVSKQKQRLLFEKAIIGCFKSVKLRESKINSKEALFSQLLSLYILPRHQSLIDDSFTKLLDSKKINQQELAIFAYEFCILSNSTSLIKIFEKSSIEINSPYLFILQHYPFLQDEDTYIRSLISFKEKFGDEMVGRIYTSKFNQNLFFGSDKFNWSVTFLFRSKVSIIANKAKLLKAGISYDVLNTSAEKKSAVITLNQIEIDQIISANKDPQLLTFINTLLKTYGVSRKAQTISMDPNRIDFMLELVE